LEDLAQNKGVLKWQKLSAPAAPPVIKYEHSTQKETRLPIYFTSQRVFRHDLHWNTAINEHPVELDKTKAPSHANQEILKRTLQQHLRSLSKQIKLFLKKSTERKKT